MITLCPCSEKNVNRNNGNRLFDSQNNAKGGYACPRPRVGADVPVDKTYYHVGSKVVVEWTNQHGYHTACSAAGKLS